MVLIEKLIAEQKITPFSSEGDLKKLSELRLIKGTPKGGLVAPQTRTTVWRHLRDGLDSFGNMPLPDDVVAVARLFDKQSKGAVVEAQLDRTIEWLTKFQQAWREK